MNHNGQSRVFLMPTKIKVAAGRNLIPARCYFIFSFLFFKNLDEGFLLFGGEFAEKMQQLALCVG